MQKLTKADLALKAVHLEKLTSARNALQSAITAYNNGEKGWAGVTHFLDSFNTLIGEANEFIEEIHSRQEAYMDDRSDTWAESEAGDIYTDWAEEWELELDTIELEELEGAEGDDDLEAPDFDQLEEFEGLPNSKEEV